MDEQLADDRDPKLGQVHAVRLTQLAGTMLLNEVHLVGRSFSRSPSLDAPLQRAQLAIGKPVRMLPLQLILAS